MTATSDQVRCEKSTQTVISLLIFLILRYVRYHNASAAETVAATEQFPGSTMRTVAVGAGVNGNEMDKVREKGREREMVQEKKTKVMIIVCRRISSTTSTGDAMRRVCL